MTVSRFGVVKVQDKPGEPCQKVMKWSKKQREQNETEQQQMMGHVKGTLESTEKNSWPKMEQFEQ